MQPEINSVTYDQLIADSVDVIQMPITVGQNQTIARGDVLEKKVTEAIAVSGSVGTRTLSVATSYLKPSGAADSISYYVIAAESATTGAGESAQIIAFRFGVFNSNKVNFGGSSTLADNLENLAKNGLHLKTAQLTTYA